MRSISLVAVVLWSCGVANAEDVEMPAVHRRILREFAPVGTTPDTPMVLVELKMVERSRGKEEVLSAPTLAMVSGQMALFEVGNHVPQASSTGPSAAADNRIFVGTHVEVRPVVLDDGRVHLSTLYKVSKHDSSPRFSALEESKRPVDIREATSDVTIPIGETVTIAGTKSHEREPIQRRRGRRSRRIIVHETETRITARVSVIGGTMEKPVAEYPIDAVNFHHLLAD